MMSAILREESSILAMAATVLAATSPPRSATPQAVAARSLACLAFSAFFRTVAVISSIDAEVSSRLAACSSVRCDRSVVLVDISAEALLISLVAALMVLMVSPKRSTIKLAASEICPSSSARLTSGNTTSKLPFDISRIASRSCAVRLTISRMK
nr:hypothetical protein [Undibacter mobilis]